jgi:UDP-N-acetylmuramoylalanine--D-glutamate ligase
MVAQGLRGQKAFVFGWNTSAVSLTQFLMRMGAEVSLIVESKSEAFEASLAEAFGASVLQIQVFEAATALDAVRSASLVIAADSKKLDNALLENARSLQIPVYTELEFVSLHVGGDVKFVSIVGTNGKSTTANLLSAMLEKAGKKVFTSHNKPVAELLNRAEKTDWAIVPTDCFQLEGIQSYTPEMVLFLNIAEDHTDRYPNYETYVAAFREILKNSGADTTLILNSQDPLIVNFIHSSEAKKILFGTQSVPEGFEGAWITGLNQLNVRLREREGVLSFNLTNHRLRGSHNRENLMAAVLAALSIGVDVAAVTAAIDEVKTLANRLQFVKRINSVAFYSDAAASNPAAMKASLHSFKEPIILIAGGRDKGLDYSILSQSVRQRVKNLLLVGEAKESLNRALGDFTETFLVGTVEEAVIMAYQKSRSGDVVLFSPGCDHTDAFKTIDERGDAFTNLILEIDRPRRPNVI